MVFKIVHRDKKGKVKERRERERGEKTAVKGRMWLPPDREPHGHGGEILGKGHGTDKGDPPADRWIQVGRERKHGLSGKAWKDERDVPRKEPRG